MKTRILLGSTFALLLFCVYFIFTDHYSFSYYYSLDKKSVVTLVHHYNLMEISHERSYLIDGRIDTKEDIDHYVQLPRSYQFILHFQSGSWVLYSFELSYYKKDKVEKIKIEHPTADQWKKMKEDKTGEYLYFYAG